MYSLKDKFDEVCIRLGQGRRLESMGYCVANSPDGFRASSYLRVSERDVSRNET